ncbi:ATPase family AAA domain-containing protein 2 [Papilio machaon]|uniref:ATPase family AAA domain-containing protein 2 n=1 Tax=Papilio machaon TaxID=76193 RepID=A0A194RMT3_PAPMA|nr:ATPase family AAA domain-containing protein 2 [Papilio machaon]
MVKTRRSNGENGEVEDGNFTLNDVVSVSDEKASNWSPRELRSSQYKVKRKIQHWPTKYSRNRLRRIRMPQIVFPESDTEPEKYSRRSRQVRVFFADDNESSNRSMQIRRNRGPRKNYMEDSEDKPIQQNVRRSCRKRKLLHHNFNESWITNELKVKGYPDLYGFNGSSSSDEFSSGDEAVVTNKKMPQNHIPTNTDEDTQLSRQRRTSARFNNKKDATESESEDENNQTVIEKKPQQENKQEQKDMDDKEDVKKVINKSDPEQSNQNQDSESNQGPARSTRGKGRGRRRQKKEDSQNDTVSESSSSESSSEVALGRQPRRSKRTRKPKPAFVEVQQEDLERGMVGMVAAGSRSAPPPARRLPPHEQALLAPQLRAASLLLRMHAPRDNTTKVSDDGMCGGVVLVSGECADTQLAPALLAQLEHCAVRELSLATLHSALAFTQEQALISLFSECRRTDRGCVLFIRDLTSVWSVLKLQELFPVYKDCVYRMREPTASEVISFLKPIITEVPLEPPLIENNELPPPLPRAPPPPPPRESAEEVARRKRKEDYKLRELRIFLRDICRKLASNRRFYKFTKPVDLEEVTDYLDIIKQPMDLETMMTKVDMHKYNCAKEFLDDIDLICANALEYNPDRLNWSYKCVFFSPPPPPPRESAEEAARRKRKEDYKLRELRIFLRDICRKLASNRRFYKFTKPVDLEEVTDYLDIIKQPMDLETMMTKVDMHKYNCAKEFLDDIDLICANALEYNPDRTSSDKQIRHEACSLRDHAHALIDVEMDSDFELECQDIAKKRREEGLHEDNDLPDFIYTASNLPEGFDSTANDSKNLRTPQNGEKSESNSAKRKRRRMNAWSKGLVVKRQKTSQKAFKDTSMAITDEECKENKPITSTPLANGSATSSGSDDDAPLRRPLPDDTLLAGNVHPDSPSKPGEKTPSKTSPKKRNSGHETSSGDIDKVLINKTELDNILYKNAKLLRGIGLKALLDLYTQLSKAVDSYSTKYDRSKLPLELHAIVTSTVALKVSAGLQLNAASEPIQCLPDQCYCPTVLA